MTPRQTMGLMLHCEVDLTEEERLALKQICQIHPQVKYTYTLFQQFAQMLRERRGGELDQWLHAGGIPEFRSFMNKL